MLDDLCCTSHTLPFSALSPSQGHLESPEGGGYGKLTGYLHIGAYAWFSTVFMISSLAHVANGGEISSYTGAGGVVDNFFFPGGCKHHFVNRIPTRQPTKNVETKNTSRDTLRKGSRIPGFSFDSKTDVMEPKKIMWSRINIILRVCIEVLHV